MKANELMRRRGSETENLVLSTELISKLASVKKFLKN